MLRPAPADPVSNDGFERFMATDGARLRRALVARYGTDVGREIASDALARAWAEWPRIREMANPAGYLYRVAQSSARRYYRWGRQPAFPVEQVMNDSEPALHEALTRLRPHRRVAVLLAHAHGYSYAEVTDLTGMTPDAVRDHVHRGVRRLRDLLEVSDDR